MVTVLYKGEALELQAYTCAHSLVENFTIPGSPSSGLGLLATWHLPGGPVGPPARWAATSNVEAGSVTEEGGQGT